MVLVVRPLNIAIIQLRSSKCRVHDCQTNNCQGVSYPINIILLFRPLRKVKLSLKAIFHCRKTISSLARLELTRGHFKATQHILYSSELVHSICMIFGFSTLTLIKYMSSGSSLKQENPAREPLSSQIHAPFKFGRGSEQWIIECLLRRASEPERSGRVRS